MKILDEIRKEIGSRELTLPIKRLIHVAGVAETTVSAEEFGRKFIDLLEEDGSLSLSTGKFWSIPSHFTS